MLTILADYVEFPRSEANEYDSSMLAEIIIARIYFDSCATMMLKFVLQHKKESTACRAGNNHAMGSNIERKG